MTNDRITIGNEKFSTADLQLLTGQDDVKTPQDYILLLARVLRDPLKLPRHLSDICCLRLKEEDLQEIRMALLRVQIDAELRMHEDIQRYQQRRYVSQVIEILLFNELLLAPKEIVEEDIE